MIRKMGRLITAAIVAAALVLALLPPGQGLAVTSTVRTSGLKIYSGYSSVWYVPSGYTAVSARWQGARSTGDSARLEAYVAGTWRSVATESTLSSWDKWVTLPAGTGALRTYFYDWPWSNGGWTDAPQVSVSYPLPAPSISLVYNSSDPYWQARLNLSGWSTSSTYDIKQEVLDAAGNVVSTAIVSSGSTATTFVTTNQQPGKVYRYSARQTYAGETSGWSNTVIYWNASPGTVNSVSARDISLSWPKVWNSGTTRVWWQPVGGNWSSATTTNTSYTLTGLTPDTAYNLAISAEEPYGGTNWRAQVSGSPVRTLAMIPGQPWLGTVTQTTIAVSWSNAGNPSSVVYELQRSTDNAKWTTAYTGTATSVTDSGLTPGATYYYRVRARNSDGVWTNFSAVSAPKRTIPAVPQLTGSSGPLAWSRTDGRGWVKLSWPAVLGANGYRVWVFDGNTYRMFGVGAALSWDSQAAKIYPADATINSWGQDSVSGDPFNHNRTGLDLRDNPNPLYQKTVGTLYNSAVNYWFKVSAYNENGDSGMSQAYTPILPNRTDSTPPAGSVAVDGNRQSVGVPDIWVALSATDPAISNHTSDPSDDASGVASYQLSNDGVNWSAPAPYSPLVRWHLDDTSLGRKIIYARFTDVAGNVSAVASYPVWLLLDTEPPTVQFSLHGSPAVVASPDVMLDVSATDSMTPSQALQMRFSNDMVAWSAWEPYAASKTWTLTTGNGTKTVYAQVKDEAGNVGTAFYQVSLNSSATQLGSAVFGSISGTAGVWTAGGAPVGVRFINRPDVTLTVNTTASTVQFSLDGLRWLPPEAAAPTKDISLPDYDGFKKVFMRLPDGSTYATYFVLDQKAPQVSARWLGDATATAGGAATLILEASDNVSAMEDLQLSTDGGNTWSAYTPRTNVTFTTVGWQVVRVMVRDQAGNVSSVVLQIYN